MKIIAIIQARMGSTRFPNKVMKSITGKPMIGLLLERLSKSKRITQIVLATSEDSKNDLLVEYVKNQGYHVFRGSENNVLERYYFAAKETNAEIVVRITGDCPLIDPNLVDQVIDKFKTDKVDYCSNFGELCYPDGLDTEVFTFSALEIAYHKANEVRQKEHVTPFLRESIEFRRSCYLPKENYSHLRWTVDEKEDFDVVERVFEFFFPRVDFNWEDILKLNLSRPELFRDNQHLVRNEGAILGTGQKLWKRAKKVIPGGNMLLSKRAEMFLPNLWPAYYSKAKGCKVWDLDGNEFIDMSIMGVGTNTLGYAHPEVDAAVMSAISKSNMSTLNCPEEVYLIEKLIEMHPWAEMGRLARSGGEANAIAIRIARASTGGDKVAICGYHGWHDWYLSVNLTETDGLSSHLLSGLATNGVPKNLRNTVFPFQYNNFLELESLVKKENIGIIKMEVSRNMGPEDGFLQKVRKLATDNSIVLIFDECTSGFRQSFGGLHKIYGVEPDIAMFGKALGNGYAITAIIGKLAVMEAAQTTFISSTFWTERIGPTAALKTLEVMENERSWERITQTGKEIKSRWKSLGSKYSLNLETWGLPALAGFTINSPNALAYKTFITQEMLSRGYLAGNSVYVCIDHTLDILDGYFEILDPIFKTIQECENGRDIKTLLKGPICHSGFNRLN